MHVVGAILVGIVVLFILGGLYLFLSVRIVGLREITFWRAFGVNCITAVLYSLMTLFMRFVFHRGMFALVVVFVLQIWILSSLLKTTWVRALGVTVVYNAMLIATVIAVVAARGPHLARQWL